MQVVKERKGDFGLKIFSPRSRKDGAFPYSSLDRLPSKYWSLPPLNGGVFVHEPTSLSKWRHGRVIAATKAQALPEDMLQSMSASTCAH